MPAKNMTAEQKAKLSKPPPAKSLSTRKQAGRTLTYVEGHYVIRTANDIFGEDGWERMFCGGGLRLVDQREVAVDGRTRYDVAMLCDYRIAIKGAVCEDVGYGIGQSYQGFGDAFESAAKEAVTDALKRCLRSKGDAFGNCLYDKRWLANRGQASPAQSSNQAAQPEPQARPEPSDGGKVAAEASKALSEAKKALEKQFETWIRSEGVQDEARPILLKIIAQELGRIVNVTLEDIEKVRAAIRARKYTATGELVPAPEQPALLPKEG